MSVFDKLVASVYSVVGLSNVSICQVISGGDRQHKKPVTWTRTLPSCGAVNLEDNAWRKASTVDRLLAAPVLDHFWYLHEMDSSWDAPINFRNTRLIGEVSQSPNCTACYNLSKKFLSRYLSESMRKRPTVDATAAGTLAITVMMGFRFNNMKICGNILRIFLVAGKLL